MTRFFAQTRSRLNGVWWWRVIDSTTGGIVREGRSSARQLARYASQFEADSMEKIHGSGMWSTVRGEGDR